MDERQSALNRVKYTCQVVPGLGRGTRGRHGLVCCTSESTVEVARLHDHFYMEPCVHKNYLAGARGRRDTEQSQIQNPSDTFHLMRSI